MKWYATFSRAMPAPQSARDKYPSWYNHASEDYGLGWRAGAMVGGVEATMPIKFARPRDAEAAADAINKAGLDTVDKIIAAGPEQVYRIMCEALAW